MSPRSTLELRQVKYADPMRGEEAIIVVLRDGNVVATIYGSREGVHIVSERLGPHYPNLPFFFQAGELPPGFVIPLLAKGEACPWCEDRGEIRLSETESQPCPVCHPSPCL